MSTLSTIKNWVGGVDYGTQANLNTIRDNLMQLFGLTPTGGQGALDFFRAVQVTAQTALAASTFVSITFDTTSELIDSASGHSTTVNNSRYIGQIPGWYEVSGLVSFAVAATGVRRVAQLALNGTAINGSQASGTPQSAGAQSVPVPVIYVQMNGTTDYVEIQGFSDVASWGTSVSGAATSALNVKWAHA